MIPREDLWKIIAKSAGKREDVLEMTLSDMNKGLESLFKTNPAIRQLFTPALEPGEAFSGRGGAADEGGRVVAKGTPEMIANNADSVTGRYLAGVLKQYT